MRNPAGVGRPRSVTDEDIVRATLAVGLHKANIRNVAEALGMSTPGLYRRVRSRDHLLNMVVRATFSDLIQQLPHFDSFKDCLTAVSRALFEYYAAYPEAILLPTSGHILASAEVVTLYEQTLDRGLKAGLSLREAVDVWGRVTAVAVGEAMQEASERRMNRAGDPRPVWQAFAGFEGLDTPHLQSLLRMEPPLLIDHFENVRRFIAHLECGAPESAARQTKD